MIVSGALSGSGGLVKSGGGVLQLQGANTYSGGTVVDDGTLWVNAGSGTGSGNVRVTAGGVLKGGGTVAGNVSVEANGILSPGDLVGTMSVEGLTLNGQAQIVIEGNGGQLDGINVTGTDTFQILGPTTIELSTTVDARGEYVLIDYNGAPLSDSAVMSNIYVYSEGYNTGRIIHDPVNTQVKIQVMYWQAWPRWYPGGDGSWGRAENWEDFHVPDGPQDSAWFWQTNSPITVTLDGDRQVGDLDVNGPATYTIAQGSGGKLMIGNEVSPGSIEANGGSHVISAPVSLAGDARVDAATLSALTMSGGVGIGVGKTLTKVGDGTLTLSGPQEHGAGSSISVTRGRVRLNSNAGLGGAKLALRIVGNSNGAEARVVLGDDQDLRELSIHTGAAGTQILDLSSPVGAGEYHGVRVYAADLEGTKRALWEAVGKGLSGEEGVVDSGRHSNSRIGVVRLSDHVYMRATRIGDVNLDGIVTIADFLVVAGNFDMLETATWQEGDLSGDGDVTIADFLELAGNFNSSYSGERREIGAEDAAFAAEHGAGVPEPGWVGMAILGGLISARRRKMRGNEQKGLPREV
jgi:autotransporter-associated beta strand protein